MGEMEYFFTTRLDYLSGNAVSLRRNYCFLVFLGVMREVINIFSQKAGCLFK